MSASTHPADDHLTPLTEKGRAQARDAGVLLRERFGVFDYLYHSGYQRTIQTADGLLSAYDESERVQRLSELCMGRGEPRS